MSALLAPLATAAFLFAGAISVLAVVQTLKESNR